MSKTVENLVWGRSIESSPKQTLLRFAHHGNDDGLNIFPSIPEVAKHVGRSARTIQRHVRQFEQLGVLVDVGPYKYRGSYVRLRRIDLNALRNCFPSVDEAPAPARLADLVTLLGGRQKGDTVTPFSQEDGGDMRDAGGVTHDAKGDAESVEGCHPCHPNYQGTIKENSRARGDHPDGSLRERVAGESRFSESAHWRASEKALRKRFGEKVFRCWFEQLIPAKDNGPGKKLILWAPSRFHRDRVSRNYADKLSQLLNREVVITFVPPTERHQARRQLGEGEVQS